MAASDATVTGSITGYADGTGRDGTEDKMYFAIPISPWLLTFSQEYVKFLSNLSLAERNTMLETAT